MSAKLATFLQICRLFGYIICGKMMRDPDENSYQFRKFLGGILIITQNSLIRCVEVMRIWHCFKLMSDNNHYVNLGSIDMPFSHV